MVAVDNHTGAFLLDFETKVIHKMVDLSRHNHGNLLFVPYEIDLLEFFFKHLVKRNDKIL